MDEADDRFRTESPAAHALWLRLRVATDCVRYGPYNATPGVIMELLRSAEMNKALIPAEDHVDGRVSLANYALHLRNAFANAQNEPWLAVASRSLELAPWVRRDIHVDRSVT